MAKRSVTRRPIPIGGRPIVAALALAALTACTDPASLAIGSASVVSAMHSGKTLSDHAMSAATGLDCAISHAFSGRRWCEQPEVAVRVGEPSKVCYRSIADVTCYRRTNPYETDSRRFPAP